MTGISGRGTEPGRQWLAVWPLLWLALSTAASAAPGDAASAQSVAASAAAEPLALGEVLIPASDRSTAARDAALRDGLAEVLVRLTGEVQAVGNPALASLLNSPARWAQRFSWQEQLVEDQPQLMLAAQFDSKALVAELERRQVAVWNLTRPPVLLWLVPGDAELLGRASDSALVAALLQRSRQRGLPVQLPLMDSQDRQAIRAADVRGHFDRVLQQAASRYPSPFQVAAVIYGGNTPLLRWRLLEQGQNTLSGELSGATETELVSALVDDLTNQLAPRYRVGGGTPYPYRLHIDGVAALTDWQALTSHIGGLVGVSNLHEVSLSPGRLTLDLQFSGEQDTLLALLRLAPRLTSCQSASVFADAPVTAPSETVAPADDPAAPAEAPRLVEMTLCWQPAIP